MRKKAKYLAKDLNEMLLCLTLLNQNEKPQSTTVLFGLDGMPGGIL